MTRFRKGDGRSRAASWTRRQAESLKTLAARLGMDADYHGSAWGSQYLTVDAWTLNPDGHFAWTETLDIRIANHASTDVSHGPQVHLSIHNETAEATKAGPARARQMIRDLAARRDAEQEKAPAD